MYVLKDVEVYTSQGSRVYHVSPHVCEVDEPPHTLCGLPMSASARLRKATAKQTQARTLCWRCRGVLEDRARDLKTAKKR